LLPVFLPAPVVAAALVVVVGLVAVVAVGEGNVPIDCDSQGGVPTIFGA
jgi:hypothetical protein